MSVRKEIPFNSGVYFITFTCSCWLPLFKRIESYDLVYNWFDILKKNGHLIHAYVVMPNHVHVIISFCKTDKRINDIVGNGKRFMAYEFVNRLKQMNEINLLKLMEKNVNKTNRNRNKQHQVFEPSFDWKDCSDIKIAEQKLNYIHLNPCKSNPPLAQQPIDYLHSSANQYLDGDRIIYPVSHLMEINSFNYC